MGWHFIWCTWCHERIYWWMHYVRRWHDPFSIIQAKAKYEKFRRVRSRWGQWLPPSYHLGKVIYRGARIRNLNNSFNQDNASSSIRLKKNGKTSSGQPIRHITIRYFFIKNRTREDELNIVYCPTKRMVADYFTKPLQGSLSLNYVIWSWVTPPQAHC